MIGGILIRAFGGRHHGIVVFGLCDLGFPELGYGSLREM